MTPKEAVFREEEKHLQKTCIAVRQEIKRIKSRMSHRASDNYTDWRDEDARLGLLDEMRRNSFAQSKVTELEEFFQCYYFGRMDLLVTKGRGAAKVIYIGYNGVHANNKQLVVDWRTPLGGLYYLKSETAFSVGDSSYQLLLRRALQIREEKLLSYDDEYVVSSAEKDETAAPAILIDNEVSDPFLRKILVERRDDFRLTDIIRTVQQNQNEIIRLQLGANFIVQGCAGSGKTMILLHRLSYLKFNNPSLNWKNVIILTPNRTFGMYINELSQQLELEAIRRMSTEEYYLSELVSFEKERWASKAISYNKRTLDAQYLQLVYSDEFINECKRNYLEVMSKFETALQMDELMRIGNTYGFPAPQNLIPSTITGRDSIETSIYQVNNYLERLRKIVDERALVELSLENLNKDLKALQFEIDKIIERESKKVGNNANLNLFTRVSNYLSGNKQRTADADISLGS
jgi:DNA helicase IV